MSAARLRFEIRAWRRHAMKSSAKGFGIALASTLTLAFAPPGLAQRSRNTASDSAAIVAIEREWIGNRDSVALDRILASDFQHPVSSGDVLDKRSNIAWLVKHPVPPGVHLQFAALTVRLYDNAAVATGIVRASNDSGVELSRNQFTDVFIRRDGRWQAVNAEETEIVAR